MIASAVLASVFPANVAAAVLAADESVKPGSPPPITFVVTALFAAAVILLGLDLVRRVRRASFRAEIQENLADEIAERDAAARAAASAEAGAATEDGSAGPAEPSADPSTGTAPGPDDRV